MNTQTSAGIERARVFVTNAVKHFKWEPRGKRHIHAKPSQTEVIACRPWLLEEILLVALRIIVCLGATAAQSLMGSKFRLTQHRGEFLKLPEITSEVVLATVHPSSLLRIPDPESRRAAEESFMADFAEIARRLAETGKSKAPKGLEMISAGER